LITEKGLSLEPQVSNMVGHCEIAELAMEVLLLPVKSWENHRENHRENMGNSTVSSPFVVRYGMLCVHAKCLLELAMEVLLLPVKSWENHRENMGNSTVSSPFVVRYGMLCVHAKCLLYFISIHRCQPLNSAKLPCVYHITGMVYIYTIYIIIYIYMLFINLPVYVSILSCLV